MRDYTKFYIDGAWVEPAGSQRLDVINPATEAVCGTIAMGTTADVDHAVAAAKRAFAPFATTSREDRIELLQNVLAEYQKRYADIAAAITEEMGAPGWLAMQAQAAIGVGHLTTGIEVLKNYRFAEHRGTTMIVKEPVGVCAFITPWNWPINQIACKVVPALATGCTMVLKPSEIAPFSGQLWAEVMHAAGVPAGVFNLVNGDGPTVGVALSSHPDVDMVSFTGSTRAGIEVAKERRADGQARRAGTRRQVAEHRPRRRRPRRGGDARRRVDDEQQRPVVQRAVADARAGAKMAAAKTIAAAAAEGVTVGPPDGNAKIGPVVSEAQWHKIQG